MPETLIGYRYARPNQRLAVIRGFSLVLALAALLPGESAREARAETLRWKLQPGEVLHYTQEGKIVENFKVMGRDKKSTRTNTTNLSWTVKSVAANGDAEISLRFDRVRMRMDQPPFVPLEFDSNPTKTEIPAELEAAERQIKAMAGAEFEFRLRPTGDVDDLKIPDQTLKKLREGVPKDAPGGDSISEQSLKELLLPSRPPPFPAASLEPGQTWTSKPSKISVPIGSLSIEQVFTFQGPDPKNPRLVVVGMEAKIALEPAQNVTAKIRAQEGKGSLTFDTEAGRIVNSSNNQKIEMIISDRGQDIVQTTETTTSMTLEQH